MQYPCLHIDIQKIRENAASITGLCCEHNIRVAGVTKVTCAVPEVAQALLNGGCFQLADSRLENIARMREHHFPAEYLLLRLPGPSQAEDVVALADYSLNSELYTLQKLNEAAQKLGKKHGVILMADLGDLREGVFPAANVFELVKEVLAMESLQFAGIGCNLACYGGVIPTSENMQMMADLRLRIEQELQVPVPFVSGGNSSGLPLVMANGMPSAINHFRVGEAIVLGRNVIDRSPFPGTHQDTFVLETEIVELKEKPSVPLGEIGQDAFGETPQFEDVGNHLRAIVAIGRQDVKVDGITPVDEGVRILGASSDHLLLDVTHAHETLTVGGTVRFYPDYGALLALATSPYVKKLVKNDNLS